MLNFDGVGLLWLHCMHKKIVIQTQIGTGFKTWNIEEAGDDFNNTVHTKLGRVANFVVEPSNLGQISTNVITFATEDIFNKVRY